MGTEPLGWRSDCEALFRLMTRATKQPARMWGPSIVGFGSYHYRYESGREGDAPVVGFSSRKGDISLYGLGAGEMPEALKIKVGKHKTGKGCLYVPELRDIDQRFWRGWWRTLTQRKTVSIGSDAVTSFTPATAYRCYALSQSRKHFAFFEP